MTANIIVSPPQIPFTLPNKFTAVFNGQVYCGVVNKDPLIKSNQVQVYVINNDGSETPVPQPLATNSGGFLVYNGSPAKFVTKGIYSLLVLNSSGAQVWYDPDVTLPNRRTDGYATVSDISQGQFPVGSTLTVTDRNNAIFKIVSGGNADGYGILDAGNGNTAEYLWSQQGAGDLRHFGGKANDDLFDSTGAAKYAASNLRLLIDGIYTISDEIVIKSYTNIVCVGKSGFKAMTGSSMAGKALVRACALKIGVTPDMNILEQQTRGISHEGYLYCDANNIADYGFYGRGISAESSLDFIVGERAKVCAVSIMTCWFSTFKGGVFGLNSGVNVSLGSGLSGETGDVFINGVSIPVVMGYRTTGTAGVTYDQDGSPEQQKAGAGVILGVGFANNIGTVTSQAASGANLVMSRAVGWSIGSLYLENGSRSTPNRKISLLVSSDCLDNSSIPIEFIHLDAGQQILHKSRSLFLDVGTLYRYDNVKSFDLSSEPMMISIRKPSYYVRNAYSNIVPSYLDVQRASLEVSASGPISNDVPFTDRLNARWIYRKGDNILKVKLSKYLSTPTSVRVTSKTSSEEYNVTDELTIGLSADRNDGDWYVIDIGKPTSVSGVLATVCIYRRVTDWSGV